MLLEKMEEIAFLHWWKDRGYRAEAWGIPAGIVSHGGGAGSALKSYKAMVTDTIATEPYPNIRHGNVIRGLHMLFVILNIF